MNARGKVQNLMKLSLWVMAVVWTQATVLTYRRIGEDRQLAGIDPVSTVLPGMIHSAHRYRPITHQSIMFTIVSNRYRQVFTKYF
jgi:hypothetical protein